MKISVKPQSIKSNKGSLSEEVFLTFVNPLLYRLDAKTLHFRRENVVLGQKVIKYNMFAVVRSLNVRNFVKIGSKIKICQLFFKKYKKKFS